MKRSRLVKIISTALAGAILFVSGYTLESKSEKTHNNGFSTYNLAVSQADQGNFGDSVDLFMEAAFETDDPDLRATALYNAATVAWGADLADYETLVARYQESLRSKVGFKEASWNLELLYYLKQIGSPRVPKEDGGDHEGKGVPRGRI